MAAAARHKTTHHLSQRSDAHGWVESIASLTESTPATQLLMKEGEPNQKQQVAAIFWLARIIVLIECSQYECNTECSSFGSGWTVCQPGTIHAFDSSTLSAQQRADLPDLPSLVVSIDVFMSG